MPKFMSDQDVVARVFGHIKNKTTDRGTEVWQEPVDNYHSPERHEKELSVIRSMPTPFCPSVALAKPGDYIARVVAGVSLIVVRGQDEKVRVFKNACRHRGTELAQGKGCTGAFVCPYHGWSYGLDGALKGIPHEGGFPDFNKLENGLAELTSIEQNGLIYIIHQDPNESHTDAVEMLKDLPGLSPDQVIFDETEMIVDANWKVHLESFLEGYHIKPLHKKSFYPYGYDNLNVIEFSGPHARVTFPFRRIETLAGVAPEDYEVSDKLTYVTHIFPNVIFSSLSQHQSLGFLEPAGVNKTKITTYHLTKPVGSGDKDAFIKAAKHDLAFVNETGQVEDIEMVTAIQRGLHSGANDVFTFGHFEPAIVHFHKELTKRVASI